MIEVITQLLDLVVGGEAHIRWSELSGFEDDFTSESSYSR